MRKRSQNSPGCGRGYSVYQPCPVATVRAHAEVFAAAAPSTCPEKIADQYKKEKA